MTKVPFKVMVQTKMRETKEQHKLRARRQRAYARALRLAKPTHCSGCSKPVEAILRARAGLWSWTCSWCGEVGFTQCNITSKAARKVE